MISNADILNILMTAITEWENREKFGNLGVAKRSLVAAAAVSQDKIVAERLTALSALYEMQFRFLDSLFFRSTVKLLVEILGDKALQFNVGSFPQCGPLAERWDDVVSKKEKKSLLQQFWALKWNLGPLDG